MRDPKYDVLFEPVRIGPLTAKNRFFQVPHCNGMGYRDPVACAEMRAVKAQGGWAVVCTEEAEIHYTIDRDEIEAVLSELGEIPDLWDLVPGTWEDDSVTSRFSAEAHEEQWVRGLKALTSKPVVGVGRFTSPDTMVRMIRQGILDFIGAARPSIADPYLPAKIEEGRIEDIRECIGCNICVSGDFTMSPIRCTQNPSMGEEWRRGWHPEHYRPRHADERVLVVGAGPAGLEATMALGKRGYEVVLVERSRTLGGRVAAEARLPGLAEWIRVVDYRLGQISRLDNVERYLESDMTAEEALSHGFDRVAVATGSVWRRDGVGRWHTRAGAMPIGAMGVLTPDDIMAGTRPEGRRVAIYDDDHYYMGGVLAELLQAEGYEVVLVTREPLVSAWTVNTMEQHRIQARLLETGVELRTSTGVSGVLDRELLTECAFTERQSRTAADAVLLVTARLPVDGLCRELLGRRGEWADHSLQSVRAVGDALAPGTIAAAV